MIRRRKRNPHQEHDKQDRWLVTYADLITLLLAFFVVLYSMSELENSRFNALIQSLKTAFHGETIVEQSNVPQVKNTDLLDKEKKKDKKDKNGQTDKQKLDSLYVKLQNYIKENHLDTLIELENLPRGVQITFKEKILFDLGKADIKENAIPVLRRIGGILQSIDNPIEVEGHTDNNPIIYSNQFHSNWELAAARAHNVAMFLIDEDKIRPERIRYTSYGEYHPRVKNDTKAHQAMNRRVNIVVLRNASDNP